MKTRCECFGGHTYGKSCPHDCHKFGVANWKPDLSGETPTNDIWSTLRGEG